MPVLYDNSQLTPAPFVDISKDFVKSNDGKKIGATFSITLQGTILAYKGSPKKTGAFHKTPVGAEPSGDSGEADEIQYALFNKASAIRKLFATEGKRLDLLTWKKDGNEEYTIGCYCFPRVSSISIDDNRYIEPLPYTISLEVDEIFHTSDLSSTLGIEDWKNASTNITFEQIENFSEKGPWRGNNRIYLSDASESWGIEEADINSPITLFSSSILPDGQVSKQSPVYQVTHQLSATGKRAFGPSADSEGGGGTPLPTAGGLIRDSWENAKIWVQNRVGVGARTGGNPKFDYVEYKELFGNNKLEDESATLRGAYKDRKYSQIFQQVDWGGIVSSEFANVAANMLDNYVPVNIIRNQDVDTQGGSYSVTERFLLIDYTNFPYHVSEEVNIDESYDYAGNTSSVTVNVTMQGHEIRGTTAATYDYITKTKYASALERYEASWDGADGESNAYNVGRNYSEASSLHSHPVSKTVAKNEKSGTINLSFVFNNRTNNLALTSAPVSESISISYQNAVPKIASIEVPGRAAGPVLQDMGTQSIASASITIDVTLAAESSDSDYTAMTQKVTSKIKAYQPTASVVYRTSDQETYDVWTKKYSRSVTWNYQNC